MLPCETVSAIPSGTMESIAGVPVYSARGQIALMLLRCLKELPGSRPKSEVIEVIRSKRWFQITSEDRLPYPSVKSREPRWETLIAWARKDCVESNLMLKDGIRDSWQISKEGENMVTEAKAAFASQQLDVRECFFWSSSLKGIMDPSYVESAQDTPRPPRLYNDLLPPWFKSAKGSKSSRMLDRFISNAGGGQQGYDLLMADVLRVISTESGTAEESRSVEGRE